MNKKVKITTILFLGINGLFILSYFFLPIINIRVPALEISQSWTPLTALIKFLQGTINHLEIDDLIVGNVMGLPTDGIAALGGLSVFITVLSVLSVLIPILAVLSVVLYFVSRDEKKLEWYSLVTSGVVLFLLIGMLISRQVWITTFYEIAGRIIQEYTYLHLSESIFRDCFPLGAGYYASMAVGIIGIGGFLVIRFVWPYLSDYMTTRTTRDDPAYFRSRNLTGNTSDTGRANRKKLPFIRLENGGKTLRISKIPCVIGRNRDVVDCYLYDESLSRRHCMIDVRDGKTWIRDLNSLYGVRINDRRIEPETDVVFYEGDLIKLGELSFKAEVDWAEINACMPEAASAAGPEPDEVPTLKTPDSPKRVVMSEGEEPSPVPMATLCPGNTKIVPGHCVINKTPYLLGRSKRNVDFTISSGSVSRKHCMIEYIDGDFYLSDLGSSNGTCINGVKLMEDEKKKLVAEDKIKLGDVVFFFKE